MKRNYNKGKEVNHVSIGLCRNGHPMYHRYNSTNTIIKDKGGGMSRVNFLYAEVKVYPASVELEPYSDSVQWDTLLIAKESVLSNYENLFDLYEGHGHLRNSIVKCIKEEMLNKGKELIYQNCPEASGE